MDEARKQRRSAQGWLTRATDNLAKAVESEGDKGDDATYAVLLDTLEKRLAKFQDLQERVENLYDDTIPDDVKLRKAEVDKAVQYLAKIDLLRIDVSKIRKRIQDGVTATITKVSTASISSNMTSVRLPRIELTKFDGDVTKWQSFWDKFVALVDKSDIPKISKFTYLESLLEGEAKFAIAGFAVTDNNYDSACELLLSRFGRKERVIFCHIQHLLKLSATFSNTKHQVSVAQLHKLHDEITSRVRSLHSLDISSDQYGIILTPVVLSCLPTDIRMEWARDGEGRESDLKYLLDFLNKEIQRRERSDTFKDVGVPKRSTAATSGDALNLNTSSTAALQTSSSRGNRKFRSVNSHRQCRFCQRYHQTEQCRAVLELNIADRKRRIYDSKLCFRCLGMHYARDCDAECSLCKGSHHSICCDTTATVNSDSTQMVRDKVSHVKIAVQGKSDYFMNCTVLPTARVNVRGENGVFEANLLFDTGAQTTYISSSLVKKVRPKWVNSEYMASAIFGSGKLPRVEERNIFEFHLSDLAGKEQMSKVWAVEQPIICIPIQKPQIPQRILKSFCNITFADPLFLETSKEIDILVGMDWYWDFMKSGLIRHKEGPVAQETIFGWVISGNLKKSSALGNSSIACLTHQLLNMNDISDDTIRQFWDLDSIGVKAEEEQVLDPILQKFEDTIHLTDGRYEVSLPWKEDGVPDTLMNNEFLAKKRLKGLSTKLSRDPELRGKYDSVLKELENSGIIEEVPKNEVRVPPGHRVFYLPHRPVLKKSSHTTKVRPVFDASAKGYNGVSLNDCVDSGPSLNPKMVEILIRFRRWPISITADITKAFLNISVRPADRDVHRFFWDENGKIRIMRFTRVPFGNSSSPFLLNATIRHHLSKYPPSDVVTELRDNLYVDDLISGADTDIEACQIFEEARGIFGAAQFSLSQWTSNSPIVLDRFLQEFGSKQTNRRVNRVLGLKWKSQSDVFTFDSIGMIDGLSVTKRVVLSFLARLYDPLGMAAPVVMTVKIIFQEMWKMGLDWDRSVSGELSSRFLSWLKGLEHLATWDILRCFFPGCAWKSLRGVNLEIFCDSSEKAYGACVYIRTPTEGNSFKTALVISKARVAPIKTMSLPRLELMGALLGARLLKFVKKTLRLDCEYRCWTDSTIVLAWVRSNSSKFDTFVRNRVSEIQGITKTKYWFHVEGIHNPADLLTRGLAARDLVDSKVWLEGPSWLSEPTGRESPCEESEILVDSQDLKLGSRNLGDNCLVSMNVFQKDNVLPVERWSSFGKALRITGLVLRAIHNFKTNLTGWKKLKGPLSYHELCLAKLKLLLLVQDQFYPLDKSCLLKDNKLRKGSSLINLSPFLDEDGLLRVGGRIQFSDLSYDEKHPVIIPKCHLAVLIIRNQHVLLKHAGVGTLISSLRGLYWIIGIRRLAKVVKKECVPCQRIDARPCNEPIAPLPRLRVKEAPPFTIVGLDYAGPLYCCDQHGKKFYILLFTCAVVRAVHLELCESLKLSDFLLGFSRFASRRGLPTAVYSDNAKTFLAAKFELRKIYDDQAPQWKFIVPRSPWWGGYWERLVGSVKSALKKSLDSVDALTPLTPSHFLIGRNSGFAVKLNETLGDDPGKVTSEDLRWKELQRNLRLDTFWRAWSTEYLRNLPTACSKFSAKGRLNVGSIVLIREDNVKRLRWPLGRVQEMFPGRDGIVRSVSLKTKNGVLIRPIQRLHNLEIAGCLENSISPSDSSANVCDSDVRQPIVDSCFNLNSVPNGSEDDIRVLRSGRIIRLKPKLDK
ncbi:hypothetical protein GQR58_010380 [Nymphon striatum]|nr:hypothetical protein GQR58_010380 [Nymphon striatum]